MFFCDLIKSDGCGLRIVNLPSRKRNLMDLNPDYFLSHVFGEEDFEFEISGRIAVTLYIVGQATTM